MTMEMTDSKILQYSFEVPLKRDAQTLWRVMTEEINKWWMADFRTFGPDSTISLEPRAGGSLTETAADGQCLEWYRVQMCVPEKSLYLVGHLAPDWGGPTLFMLKLGIEGEGDNCTLKVSDALLGNITEKSGRQAKEGWELLFTDGLKAYAEAQGS